ncbi:MAG: aminotransferase, partial [Actinobacteria bacterium]|nr:aminotransferase [Actinomycetota bacterium]
VARIRARNQELTGRIIEEMDRLGLELLSPRIPERRGGLVRGRVAGGRANAERILHALFTKNVVLDQRGDALRISPHFFNHEDDIDRCFAELAKLV